ncbi:hypothetical protein ANOM_005918 [Aspergillus nomiae NRRL 13137]|uniref:Methyltransferase type 12 domain-containing protein n=1 Tax=Aspergillus nomiae NRRL (strain ATCC 15546 / NRRL 13137 / CBS 260.88 / M93) TaxID=1509407 RepID=A0A0L1J6J4_ASPN3|nr:uncharacterized protein ANOM_005918 [Aspergillus nomiae NRRL 13137]KNG87367.1 hypothetical protein ANOM_005918 [Aspergillus nomiae NRRL 13137]
MSDQELYLLNNRDQTESQRLDLQHEIIASFMGYELLHPSISIEMNNGLNIADVGTGTGIWLKRLSSCLKPHPTVPACHLHGFDISSDQFPGEQEDIDFTIHDITQPFPSEHLGRYDIVHIRLLVLALRGPDIVKALGNVIQLLRPSGFLQWEDVDWCYTALSRPGQKTPEALELILEYMGSAGLSGRLSDLLINEGKKLELQELRKYEYSTLENPDHYADIQLWFDQIIQTILPVTVLRSGQAGGQDEAKDMASQMMEEIRAAYSGGSVPDLRVSTVIGRRNC